MRAALKWVSRSSPIVVLLRRLLAWPRLRTVERSTEDPRQRFDRAGSRTIRLFVSSTFQDMQDERTVLRKEVFPVLRDYCESRGASFFEVDLRWGVTREEAESGRVLSICLGEIDRCRPFVLGMIGGRYGWVDPSAKSILESSPKFERVLDYADRSVTELELRYAICDRPSGAATPLALVYERPSSKIGLDGSKFSDLKSSLQTASVVVRDSPADLGLFARQLRADLLGVLKTHFDAANVGFRSTERDRAQAVEQRLEVGYVAQPELDLLVQFLREGVSNIAVIGRAGAGKSMLAAALARYCRSSDQAQFVASAVNVTGWGAWPDALASIVEQVVAADRPHPRSDVAAAFEKSIAAISERGHAIVILDGVNDRDLSGRGIPSWCPRAARNTTFVVFVRQDVASADDFAAAGWSVVRLDPLESTRLARLSQATLVQFGRRLDDGQLERISTGTRLALEQAILVEELRCVSRFEELDSAIDQLISLRGLDGLTRHAIQRLRSEHVASAEKILSALTVAQYGMSETLLKSIAGTTDDPLSDLDLAVLRQEMSSLVAFAPERVELRSSALRETLRRELHLGDERDARSILIELLTANVQEHGAAEELIHQLSLGKEWDRLHAVLCDANAFRILVRVARQRLRAAWSGLLNAEPHFGLHEYCGWIGNGAPLDVAEAAVLCRDLGDIDAARRLAEDAMTRATSSDARAGPLAISVLAEIAETRGDFQLAETLLQRLLDPAALQAVPELFAFAAVRQLRLAFVRHGLVVAKGLIADFDARMGELNDPRLKCVIMDMRGQLAIADRKYRPAERLYRELLRQGNKLNDLQIISAASIGLARTARARGRLHDAAAHISNAKRFAAIVDDPYLLQDALGVEAKTAIETYQYDKASDAITERSALAARTGDVIGRIETQIDKSRLYAHLGQSQTATGILAKAGNEAQALGLQYLDIGISPVKAVWR